MFFSASSSPKLSELAKMRTSAMFTSRCRNDTATSIGIPCVGSITSSSLCKQLHASNELCVVHNSTVFPSLQKCLYVQPFSELIQSVSMPSKLIVLEKLVSHLGHYQIARCGTFIHLDALNSQMPKMDCVVPSGRTMKAISSVILKSYWHHMPRLLIGWCR